MQTPPFQASAAPIEFTPASQDADRFEREKTRAIRQREQANARAVADYEEAVARDPAAQDADALDRLALEAETIGEEWPRMQQAAAQMRQRFAVPQTFIVAVPTSIERDQVNSRLVALGLSQVTQEQIRATMIEQLYYEDWSQPGETLTAQENEGRAEDNANFLDSVWLRSKAHNDAIEIWEEQERERILDEAHGAPARAPTPEPAKLISIRDVSRAALLTDRMMSTNQPLRDLAAAQMDFSRRNAVLLVRMHLIGVKGFEPTVPLTRDPRLRALSDEAVAALREQVDDVSWTELISFIDRLYSVEEAERKNFDSLPEKQPHPIGSTEPNGGSGSNGGSSTASSSTPAPDAASGKIIAPSSGSTSASDTEAGPTPANDFPTAGE